ncbi:DOC10 protein, partial [Polyodon spathula]|nr:DOC10 protein [Polyodon spathula]
MWLSFTTSIFSQCIYGKPGGPVFTTTACTTVLHHSQNPDFYDEVKIELPAQLHEKHHLLFSFYHVTCDINTKTNAKKKETLETAVGYAWLPLLKEGMLVSQEHSISVANTLPLGYLNIKEPGSGKDPHLNRFFQQCQKRESDLPHAPTSNFINSLQGLQSIEKIHVITRFLPVLFNQLLKVLIQNDEDEIITTTTRVLVHIVAKCHEEHVDHYLRSYEKVQYEAKIAIASLVLLDICL